MLSIANSSIFLFIKKLESVQYNAALALTCVIRGEKLYYELGLELLEQRHWRRKLWCFYAVSKTVTKTGNNHNDRKLPANDHKPPVNDHKPPADNHKSMANDHKPPGNDHKQP